MSGVQLIHKEKPTTTAAAHNPTLRQSQEEHKNFVADNLKYVGESSGDGQLCHYMIQTRKNLSIIAHTLLQ